MEQFDAFMREHFPVFFLVAVVLGVANLGWRFFRRWRSGVSFPPLNSIHVRFHEGMASGNSDRTVFSRLGGARHSLRVTVTDDEVWVRSFFPFNLIMETDLEHRIARDSITSAQLAQSWFGRHVALDFRLPDGSSRRLSLVLRDADGFLAALQGPNPPPR